MIAGRGRSAFGLLFSGGLVAALVLLPVAYLVVRASEADAQSWDLILRTRTLWLAARTLGLAAAVTLAAVALGVPAAWLTARTDLPGRRVWSLLLALPLVVPSYVGAFALLAALGPRGLLRGPLQSLTGWGTLPDISGFPGAFLALTLFTYPYVYLLVGAAIRGLDPGLEDAGRSLGMGRWRGFFRLTLPLLRPSIAAGGLLVALYTLHDFGAVSMMRFQAFTQAIYLQYRGAFDRTPAAIFSLMLIALAAAILVAERKARGRARYSAVRSSARPPRQLHLGRWKWVAIAFCTAIVLLAFVLPMTVVIWWFVRDLAAGGEARLTWVAAAGSIGVSAVGAMIATVAALPLALIAVRRHDFTAVLADRVSWFGYALPGLVVALSFVFFAANFAPALYQTLPLVVVAYVVLFLPQSVEPIRTALLQVSPRFEEVGRSLGRSRMNVFAAVVAPLIARGAVAGAALVFLTAMKELPATLLLRPTGFETLATRVWTGATAGLYSKAAGPALLLVVVCAVPLYFLARHMEVRRVPELEMHPE